MNALRLDAAIIDLDGTMVDTLGDFVVALNAMLDDLALPAVERHFVEQTVGKGSEHLVRRTLAHAGAAPERFDAAFARYQHHYLAINGRHSELYPGVVEGLRQLQAAGLKLACLTNKPGAFARPLLAAKGIEQFFTFVFGGDAFSAKKPDPLPLLKTCEALGTAPSATWMVGDSRNDAEAARGAGCPIVLMTYGYNHGEDVRAIPARAHLDRLDAISACVRA